MAEKIICTIVSTAVQRWMVMGMAKEICIDCGNVFDGGAKAFYCLECRKRRIREAAKARNLNKLGSDAYSAQQARRRAENGCLIGERKDNG